VFDTGHPVARCLAFFALAMQCLPTLAVTRREKRILAFYAACQFGLHEPAAPMPAAFLGLPRARRLALG
jgi:hypothetical protein